MATYVQSQFKKQLQIMKSFETNLNGINIRDMIQQFEVPDFKFEIPRDNKIISDNAKAAQEDCKKIDEFIKDVKQEQTEQNKANLSKKKDLEASSPYFQFIAKWTSEDSKTQIDIDMNSLNNEFNNYIIHCLQSAGDNVIAISKYITKIVRATYQFLLSKYVADTMEDSVHYSKSPVESDREKATDEYKLAFCSQMAEYFNQTIDMGDINEYLEEHMDKLREFIAADETIETDEGPQTIEGYEDPDAFEEEHDIEGDADEIKVLENLDNFDKTWQLIVRVIFAIFIAGGEYVVDQIGVIKGSGDNAAIVVLGPFTFPFGQQQGDDTFEWYISL